MEFLSSYVAVEVKYDFFTNFDDRNFAEVNLDDFEK